LRARLVAVDTPAALRARLFGARLRVMTAQPAASFVDALTGAGFADVVADGTTLSIGVDDTAAAAPAIVRRLVERGADIRTVVPEEPPLEQVYLRLLEEERAGA
jgi:ABC-2 type transport system ATP-binding protein